MSFDKLTRDSPKPSKDFRDFDSFRQILHLRCDIVGLHQSFGGRLSCTMRIGHCEMT